MVLLFIRFRW